MRIWDLKPRMRAGAKIAIVGDCPSSEDCYKGRFFSGSDGRLLGDMSASVGIRLDQCYLTTVVKSPMRWPDWGRFYTNKSRTIPTEEMVKIRQGLIEEIKSQNVNLVVCVGYEATKALLGKSSLDNWRGSLVWTSVGKTMCTFPPDRVRKMYAERPIVEADLKRAREESFSRELVLPETRFLLAPEASRALEWLGGIKEGSLVTFDIETSSVHTRCIALGVSSMEAMCIPFVSSQHRVHPGDRTIYVTPDGPGDLANHYSLEEELEILRALQRVFSNPKIGKIAQNFPFDSTILGREFGIDVRGLWMDTMVAQHTVYPELPKGLDFLCSIYTRFPCYWEYDAGNDIELWTYNCFDAIVTFAVAERLQRELEESGMTEFYKNFAQPTMIALARAANRGCRVDKEEMEKLKTRLEVECKDILERFHEASGQEINLSSPKQLVEFLYDLKGFKRQFNRKSGNVTTDEKALENLARTDPRATKWVDMILDYRKKTKLAGGVLSSKLTNGRMGTSYNATGTKTGRISSSQTLFGEGTDLQNIPKSDFRRFFIADEGTLLIKCDLSQAEARVVAWEGNIRELIDKFLDPSFDIHSFNASILWGLSIKDVTKDLRQRAKAIVHGRNYMLGVRTAAAMNRLPYGVVKEAFERYDATMPGLVRWQGEIREEVIKTRMTRTIHGRRRIYFGRVDEAMIRSAVSTKPQSTVGDCINRAFMLLDVLLEPLGGFPLLQVHDEIVSQIPRERLHEGVRIVRNVMEYPMKFSRVPEMLVIPAEIEIGENWWDLERYDPSKDYNQAKAKGEQLCQKQST